MLIAFGIVIRLVQYLSNRSLWNDEAALAANILNRSYLELLGKLEGNQAAPPLFLWLEKLSLQLLGAHDLSLRIIPFLAGILSLILFSQLTSQFLKGMSIPIAIGLFATLKYTVYYSAEVKPYGVDLAVALFLFLMLISVYTQRLTLKQNLTFGGLGMVAIWLAYPSIFVLAAVELCTYLRTPLRKVRSVLVNRSLMYSMWFISFLSLYFLIVQQTLDNADLVESWAARYPDSWLDFLWLVNAFGRFFYRPLGFLGWTDGVAMFAFCCGCIRMYRRDKWSLLLLNMPLSITLLAGYAHQYPFRDRLVYFLTPFAIVMIAEGITLLLSRGHQRSQLLNLLGIVVLGALLIPPFTRSTQQILNPNLFHFHHIRPVLQHIQTQWQHDDHLFIFPSAEAQFTYYNLITPFPPEHYSFGQYRIPSEKELVQLPAGMGEPLQQALDPLQEKARVWFLVSASSEIQQQALLAELSQMGQQLDLYQQPDAMTCLYTLNPQPTPTDK
ncbi:MAG: hypothetical protein F6K42_13550 [Leptolyngbya sp. SIO1D8]|nr:hypothetical protein [Leptolyngbya sp. SIO1D8]